MPRWSGNTAVAARAYKAGTARGICQLLPPQPFFETSLNPAYCAGYACCTQTVAAKAGNNGTGNIGVANVWSLWSELDGGAFNFPRSMMNETIPGSSFGGSGQSRAGSYGRHLQTKAGEVTLKVPKLRHLPSSNATGGGRVRWKKC